MSNNAVGNDRVSRITGYKMTAGDFSTVTPNLPQRIAVLGEGNSSNQATMPTVPTRVLSVQEAGTKFGFGSPIYNQVRILLPVNGGGVNGIPVIVYPQVEGGNVAKEMTITVVGTVTENITHNLVINGRQSIDGDSFAYNVAVGDSVTDIAVKIKDAVNNVLGASFIATSLAGVVTLVTKWKGMSTKAVNVSVESNDNLAGLTYAVATPVIGSGTPSVASALTSFGNEWNTIVVSAYEVGQTTVMDELEAFNGRPDATNPTGRFVGIVMKPLIALVGSLGNSFGADTTMTIAKRDDLTIAVCPAPLSKGLPMEASANMCVLFANVSQNNPHLDVAGQSYPDMPTYDGITVMSDYNTRDAYVKAGHSTVDIVSGAYQVQDFVTTYHPLGESVPQYRFCRNLVIDFNVKYGYYLLEQINVVDHAIADNDDTVNASKVIKPKQWIAILNTYADGLAKRSLIAKPSFMTESLTVGLSATNPDRLETFFRYKRTGFARVLSTTAEAGFNFGI